MSNSKKKIRTSQSDWLQTALECYMDKKPFEFLDDKKIGITSDDLATAVELIRKAKEIQVVTWREIVTILTGMGLSGVGVWMIAIAVADPEPTSKLWIILAGGVVLTLTGGLSILRALGQKWRIDVKKGNQTITVEPN